MIDIIDVADSNGTIRIWSIRTGAVLFCLHRATNDNEIPQIAFSESLGGADGRPSLIATDNSSMIIYHM